IAPARGNRSPSWNTALGCSPGGATALMTDYHKHVETALRVTDFHSSTRYSWFGQPMEPLPRKLRKEVDPNSSRAYVLLNLQARLYRDFYCRGRAMPSKQELRPLPLAGRKPFVELLSAANTGSGSWEGGWELRALNDGQVMVRKGGLELLARREDCSLPEVG